MSAWDDNEILIREHPELHHYTGRAGLEGIWKSQSIWASHFEQLNDAQEITAARHFIASETAIEFEKYLRERVSREYDFAKRIMEFGTIHEVAVHEANAAVDAHYEAAFNRSKGYALAEPYITSFCSHSNDHEYERKNGLLSHGAVTAQAVDLQ